MGKEILISIIIATFNAGNTLERCLKSIFSQNCHKIETIIQDGGSRDNTPSIVHSYGENIARFSSSDDRGIYDAWNRALPHCKGDWICFLGADDYFLDQSVLNRYARYLETINHRQHTIVYGINQVVNQKGELLYSIGQPWHELEAPFRSSMCLPHPGLMHHRSLFDSVGLFDPSYRIAGDYELLLRGIQYHPPVFWPNIVCATPLGGISTSPTNNLKCLIEMHRAKKQNGINSKRLYDAKQWMGALVRLGLWYTLGENRFRRLLDAIRVKRGRAPFWTRAV